VVVKHAGSERGMIRTLNRFWAEYGSGISDGVQDGSLISSPCRMKNKRNYQSTMGSANTKRDIDIPHLIDYIAHIIYLHVFFIYLTQALSYL
jgi:hypothetical protein